MMKKLFFAAALSVGLACGAQAQSGLNSGSWKFGLKAGVNLSSISGFPAVKGLTYQSRIGYSAGAYACYPLDEKWAIQPELILSSQGNKNEFKVGDKVTKTTFSPLYLNVPVLAKYFVASNFSLNAGPQFGLLVDRNATKDNKREDVKTFDLGISGGATYYLNENWNLDARYTYGISTINKKDIKNTDIKYKGYHNNVFQLGIGYTF